MLSNSRNAALIIALSVSVITTSFLFFISGITFGALMATLILSFSSAYILTHFTVEYFIFGQMKNIHERLSKLKEDDLSVVDPTVGHSSKSLLKLINEEISKYAVKKQKEIEELKKAETFRREFIADVSHELKTPIFAAQGFVHTLLDGAVKDKNVRTKFLKKAAKSLDGLDMLVQDLLTISKMETGDVKMDFEDFNIHDLVQEVFDQFESKAGRRDVKLAFNPESPDDLGVYADWNKIYQVMANLISNAMKYNKEKKGRVVVELNPIDNSTVEICVQDNGVGIPPEHINRIFERFYRVDKSRSKENGGTGLGLSIVKHILEAHHTTIQVQSKTGEGSQFRFKLKRGKNIPPTPVRDTAHERPS